MADAHVCDRHAFDPARPMLQATVGDMYKPWKLRPVMVTDSPPLMGAFSPIAKDTTGASNVNNALLVPMWLAMVNDDASEESSLKAARHDTVVEDDHDVVPHVPLVLS